MAWQTKKLGDICEVSTGSSNTNEATADGKYAFFDRSKIIKRSSRFLFDCEALIIPGEGAEFFPRYYSGKFDLHQRAYALFNFDKSADIKFIEYYLTYNHKYFERVAVGATAKSLRRRHFLGLEVPLPPLPEQNRIVKILDAVFERTTKAKYNTEQNRNNANELYSSILGAVFSNRKDSSWEESALGDLFKIERGGSPRPIKDFITTASNGINWIKIGDVEVGSKYIYKTEEKIRPEGVKRSRMVYEGDFLLSNSMSFGRPYILKITGCIHDGWLVIRRNDEKIDQDYLFYFLSSAYAYSQFDYLAAGSTVRNLNTDLVRKVRIHYPKSIAEQRKIAKALESISERTQELETVYAKKSSNVDGLRASVLHQAFTQSL